MGILLRKGRGATLREQLISLGMIKEAEPKEKAGPSPKDATVTKSPNVGIDIDHWFWAAVGDMGTRPAPKRTDAKETAPAPIATAPQSEDEITKMLLDCPSGSTFYNLLKSKGWKFVAPELSGGPKEADAASAQPVGIFAGTNPLKKKQESSGGMKFRAKFLEATTRSDTAKQGFAFRCVLLSEGLGNLKDQYYYSKEAIQSAIPIFEGKKIYADHPSSEEETIRPERSVRDILGHFEGVTVEEKDGISQLVGDVRVMPDQSYEWARALMREAVTYAEKYPDKDFIGLSINAGGDAEEKGIDEAVSTAPDGAKPKLAEAKEKGVEKVNWVSRITEAVSCDLVTEAGAGGRVLAMLETDKTNKETKDMAKKVKESENEKKVEGKEAAPALEAAPAPAADAAPAAPHSDEQQDKDLIKKMLDEYLGAEDHAEETFAAGHEAHKAAMEMGEDAEAAYHTAGKMMKMARHMQNKKEAFAKKGEAPAADAKLADDAEKKPEGEEKKPEPQKQEEAKAKEDEAKHKESAIALQGEIAGLKEKLAVYENEKFLDKLFQESKLPNRLTKKFREALGEKIPASQKEIETKFKLFREGLKAADDGEGLEGLVIQQEKTGEPIKSIDFSDCTN